MKVRFRVNLGSIDAAKFQLDHEACQAGCDADVSNAAAKWLAERGIVEPLPKVVVGVAKAPEVKGVPPKAEQGTVEKATADLQSYRDKETRKPKDKRDDAK